MPSKIRRRKSKNHTYYLRRKQKNNVESPSFNTLENWTRFSNDALEAITNAPEHQYMEPLPKGQAPHLAILEPYSNLHITFEDGVAPYPESTAKHCGNFQESVISDVEDLDAFGILVTEADISHSVTFLNTDPVPIITTLNEKRNKEVKIDENEEEIVCEKRELEKCAIIKKEVLSYPETNDPLSSDVTYINLDIKEEPCEEEEDEKEMEVEENEIRMYGIGREVSLCEDKEEELEKLIIIKNEDPFQEDHPISINEPVTRVSLSVLCLSVRIGSFKIYPLSPEYTLNVFLSMDGISFYSPMVTDDGISFYSPAVTDENKSIKITIKPCDITHMLVHFGKSFPVIFVITTPIFAEAVRRSLNTCNTDFGFYDPTSNDEKMNKITFLLNSTLGNEQCLFLQHRFKLTKLDKQTANELLVKSTP